ncbi:MAG: 7-cyano-7-deazaguanine synthase QueC [Candidatus Krumholzibacteriota bacterium]|nr:7-cyano-7-deazaguanine synthase QueC [Candidatus Krumholzibacteriota bacterium]
MKRAERGNRGALALVSGGLDSTVSLALAVERGIAAAVLFFDYGQKARRAELSAARRLAAHYALPFELIDLPWLGRLSASALVEGGAPLPHPAAPDLDDPMSGASRAVWVENRNGIMLNAAAAVAAARGLETIIVGFNREEAAAFPDNGPAFLDAVNASLALGVRCNLTVASPTIAMDKGEIVCEGVRLGVPWEIVWSCYDGEDEMCGVCESCRRLLRAVEGTPAAGRVRFRKESR